MVEITMDGPAKNALGTGMLTWLLERLAAAKGQPVLLTGTADAFSAGLNLKEVASLEPEGMTRYLRLLERCMSAFYLYPAPTVALINGHAIAGGCVLALTCDYRVMTNDPRARVGLNEVALGVRYPPRVFRIVTDRIPRASQAIVLLGAGLYGPDDARGHGLVDEVSIDPARTAAARLEALAAHPADGYAATKAALRGTVDADLAPETVEAAWIFQSAPSWSSEALKERIRATLKR